MYNKRNMEFLKAEIEKGQHPFLIPLLKKFNNVEQKPTRKRLLELEPILNEAISMLSESGDQKGWRRDLLLNYYLNLELYIAKQEDNNITKWNVFISDIEERSHQPIIDFVAELEKYVDANNRVKEELTVEKMQHIQHMYDFEILPYIKEKMDHLEQYRTETRLTQRINLVRKKLEPKNSISFGDWLKNKRLAKGWSLNELAKKAGYSPAYIFRIEKGSRKNPTAQVVSKLVTALGYKPDDYLNLIMGEEQEKLNSMDVSDLILLSDVTFKGKEMTEEKREQLAKIVDMLGDEDVLRLPKIHSLQEEIEKFQRI